jgi:undecaprenyl diphosphate synthase
MIQSTLHIGIIMDGNGRWATARGLNRLAGHRKGVEAARRVIEAAPTLGIRTLTLYAFSSDNWRRPMEEVAGILGLLQYYLERETDRCVENGIRVSVIGRRDRLPPEVTAAIVAAELATSACTQLHVRIAVDYSSRDMILQAAQQCAGWSRDNFAIALGNSDHGGTPAPDVDLLLRTGGEKRLSDFLLWECAYAELYFTDRMWPDFCAEDLEAALQSFRSRERRFGAVPAPLLPAISF